MKFAVAALVLSLAAAPAVLYFQESEGEVAHCAPVDKEITGKDGIKVKPCHCDATKNKGCDKEGNRSNENMAGCVNSAHCKKHDCQCCPRD